MWWPFNLIFGNGTEPRGPFARAKKSLRDHEDSAVDLRRECTRLKVKDGLSRGKPVEETS